MQRRPANEVALTVAKGTEECGQGAEATVLPRAEG